MSEGSAVVKEHNEKGVTLLAVLKPREKTKKGGVPLLAAHSIRKIQTKKEWTYLYTHAISIPIPSPSQSV